MPQVILEPGEKVPADPGLCRKKPAGYSTYAQAGGVYPLAQFADVLVDLALSSKELQVCTSSAPPLHLLCTSSAPPLHLLCTSSAP